MDLSNQTRAETIVGAEMNELSLEYLASVSGGGDGNTVAITCKDAKVTDAGTSYGQDRITVTCQSPPKVVQK